MARKKSARGTTGPKRYPPNRVAELAQARRISYEKIAEQLGVHRQTVAKLANRTQRLTHAYMIAIGKALGVPPEQLIAKAPTEAISLRPVPISGEIQAGAWV